MLGMCTIHSIYPPNHIVERIVYMYMPSVGQLEKYSEVSEHNKYPTNRNTANFN